MIGVKYNARLLFYFQKLKSRVRIARNKALYRTAGLIRTSTKRSMRLRRGPSRPGTPPHAHTRMGLRVIEFIVDDAAGAAMIGPLKFPGSNYFNEPVPFIEEFGGRFISRRSYATYPERSFMYYTLKKLVASGKIPTEFAVSMAQVL